MTDVDAEVDALAQAMQRRARRVETVSADVCRAAVAASLFGSRRPTRLGRFEILRRIGAGGMGVVYEARDTETGERVALKTLQSLEPDLLYRLKREFRHLANVRHPNLVPLHELFVDQTRAWFTMQRIEGLQASAYIDNQPPIGELRAVLAQIASGLAHLHAHGKLHLDLKPSNVMIAEGPHAVLLDFGLARSITRDPWLESAELGGGGTPAYMAPEQWRGEELGPPADWYAFGLLIAQMLTGRPPTQPSRIADLVDASVPRIDAQGLEGPRDLVDLCVALTSPQPGDRPDATRILGVLTSSPRPESLDHEPQARLAGRVDELATLQRAASDARSGHLRAVLVVGPSGIGKTFLVQHFLEQLRAADAVVLGTRCYEREAIPFRAVDGIVDSLSARLLSLPADEVAGWLPRHVHALADMFPTLRRVPAIRAAPRPRHRIADATERRRLAFAAFRELVARIGDRKLLVLSFDDLQWGDQDSADLLAHLVLPPDPPAALLVATARDGAVEAPVPAALAQALGRDVARVDLAALSDREAQSLARCHLGPDTPQHVVDRVVEQAAGAPLYCVELASQAALAAAEEPSLEAILSAKVSRLDGEAARVLEVVALSGAPIPWQAVKMAAGDPSRRSLDVLVAERLVAVAPGPTDAEIEPWHDRIAQVVVGGSAVSRVRALHREIADGLESLGTAATARIVEHRLGAGQLREAGRAAALAGQDAARSLAFDRAAELFRIALDHAELEPSDRQSLQADLGGVLASAGRGAAAAEAFLEATVGAADDERFDLRRRAAEQLLCSGRVRSGSALLRDVMAEVGLRMPRGSVHATLTFLWSRARFKLSGKAIHSDPGGNARRTLRRVDACLTAGRGLSFSDPVASAAIVARGLRWAIAAGDPDRIARVLALHSIHVALRGTAAHPEARSLLARAQAAAAGSDSDLAKAMVKYAEAVITHSSSQWPEAVRLCDEAAIAFRTRCIGAQWEITGTQIFAASAQYWLGDLNGVRNRLARELAGADSRGDLFAGVTERASGKQAILRLAAGDPDRASREVEQSIARWTGDGVHIQHWYAFQARTQIDVYRQAGEQAWEHMLEVWPRLAKSGLHRAQVLRVTSLYRRGMCGLEAARAAAGRGATQAYLDDVRRQCKRLRREPLPWARSLATTLTAGVALHQPGDEDRIAALDEAVRSGNALGMALFAAAAEFRKGKVIGGRDGELLVRHASDTMARVGVTDPERMSWVFLAAPPE